VYGNPHNTHTTPIHTHTHVQTHTNKNELNYSTITQIVNTRWYKGFEW